MLNQPKSQPVCSHYSLAPAPELRLNRRALSVGQVSLSNTFPSGLGPTSIPICAPLNTERALCRGRAGSVLKQLARTLQGLCRAGLGAAEAAGAAIGHFCRLDLNEDMLCEIHSPLYYINTENKLRIKCALRSCCCFVWFVCFF